MRGNPDDLDLARRHVAEAKVRIANQRRLIRKLRRHGHPTDLAESLLASLTELLRQMQAHEAFLSGGLRTAAEEPCVAREVPPWPGGMEPAMAKRDIIVIGGSAGSTPALKAIVAGIPAGFGGNLFVTTHIPADPPSYLPEVLSRQARLPVVRAIDGQPIEPGHIYIAAPDRHLLLLDSTLRLGTGPRENMVRPGIDPMFRSAALSFGPRVVGVILSGCLSDGASGLFAIKQAGGAAVVQHPLDALEDGMPRAALEAVQADHVAPAAELAEVLLELAASDAPPARPPPESLVFEVEIANGARLGSEALRQFADPAALTCPDCGGVLSQVRGERPLRFRCQIGHAYTAEELAARNERVDEAIRVAMRVMEERVDLVERMARDARLNGRTAVAELYEGRVQEYRRYAATLREAAVQSMRLARSAAEQAA